MRSHFVPVSYLKAFANKPALCQYGRVHVIERERDYYPSIKKVCVNKNYYSHFPSTDSRLFQSQEMLLGSLANVNHIPDNFAIELWKLKIRNKAILDFTNYRELIVLSNSTIDLGLRTEWFVEIKGDSQFITCDDPLIVYGGNSPEEMCFMLTVSPSRLVISAPTQFYSNVSSIANIEDVELVNKLVCHQIRRCAITHPSKRDVDNLRLYFPAKTIKIRSDIMWTQSPFMIINFHGPNPQGPNCLPSFISLK